MEGLKGFALVLAGTRVPIESIELDVFDLDGRQIKQQIRLPAVIQASADEYALQMLPDRFMVIVNHHKATGQRIGVLETAARRFVEEYAGRKGVGAVGHNFTGTFKSPLGAASDFFRHVAWPADFATAVGGKDPVMSISVRVPSAVGTSRGLRLEPSAEDPTRVFYDINVAWGEPVEMGELDLDAALSRFGDSFDEASQLVERLMAIGPT